VKALHEKNIDPSLITTFPFNLAVQSGLKSGSEYWMQLALNWLAINKTLITDETLRLLKSIPDNKQYPQKIRHAVRKIYKKININ